MELPYVSETQIESPAIQEIEPVSIKILSSIRNYQQSDGIGKLRKERILNFLIKDSSAQLLAYLDKQAITPDKEIGPASSQWNLLHFAAKLNSVACLRCLARKMYQEDPEDYIRNINLVTSEGYSPLMIAVIHYSTQIISLLFHFGGIDIHTITINKMSAYDLALSHGNQQAIRLLLSYENRSKTQTFINHESLSKPLPRSNPSCCEKVVEKLLNYLFCINEEPINDLENGEKIDKQQIEKNRAELKYKYTPVMPKRIEPSFVSLEVDQVTIGDDMEAINVQWKRLSDLNGQKMALFDSFKPFDICESSFMLRNNLIIFQCLSEHPWLIRRAIKRIEQPGLKLSPLKKSSTISYSVSLFKNFASTRIIVNECIPYLPECDEVMFLSNSNQLWPMILQKALAKLNGSYVNLGSMPPKVLLEQITGFPTQTVPIENIADNAIQKLQELSAKGYLLLFEGRQGTDLTPYGSINCFTILNYYEKSNERKILVNCSQVSEEWREKEKSEPKHLKILKSHHSTPNQMSVWLDEDTLSDYFTQAYIVRIDESLHRAETKVACRFERNHLVCQENIKSISQNERLTLSKYHKSLFFRINIKKPSQESLMLQLIDVKSHCSYYLSSFIACTQDGLNVNRLQSIEDASEQFNFPGVVGEHICKIDIEETSREIAQSKYIQPTAAKKNERGTASDIRSIESRSKKSVTSEIEEASLSKELAFICWAPCFSQPEFIQEEFGVVEWFTLFKTRVFFKWNELLQKREEDGTAKNEMVSIGGEGANLHMYCTVNSQTMIIVKSDAKDVRLLIGEDIQEEEVIEGEWREQDSEKSGKDKSKSKGKDRVSKLKSVKMVREEEQEGYHYCVVANMRSGALTFRQK